MDGTFECAVHSDRLATILTPLCESDTIVAQQFKSVNPERSPGKDGSPVNRDGKLLERSALHIKSVIMCYSVQCILTCRGTFFFFFFFKRLYYQSTRQQLKIDESSGDSLSSFLMGNSRSTPKFLPKAYI